MASEVEAEIGTMYINGKQNIANQNGASTTENANIDQQLG